MPDKSPNDIQAIPKTSENSQQYCFVIFTLKMHLKFKAPFRI